MRRARELFLVLKEGKTVEKRTLNRRGFLRLSTTVAAGAIVAACAPAAPQIVEVEKQVPVEKVVKETVVVEKEVIVEKEAKPVKPVTIIMQCQEHPHEREAWSEFEPGFIERHPNIKVVYRPTPDNYWERLQAQFVAKDAPDVISTCCAVGVEFLQRGQALNMQPYIDRDFTAEEWADFNPNQFTLWKDDTGNILAIPKYAGNLTFYYNIDMFDEEGVDHLPRKWDEAITYDEYLDIMLKFSKDEGGRQIRWGCDGGKWLGGRTETHFNAWGCDMVDPEDNTHCVLDTPEAQDFLQWWYDAVWEHHGYPTAAESGEFSRSELFYQKRIAMLEEGVWRLRPTSEAAQFKWDLTPNPIGPAGHRGYNTIDNWIIWSGTKYPDESWEVAKELGGVEYVRILAKWAFLQPSRRSVISYWIQSMREEMPVMEDVYLETFAEIMATDPTVEGIFKRNAEAMEILNPIREEIYVLGKKDPSAFIEAAKKVTEQQRAD